LILISAGFFKVLLEFGHAPDVVNAGHQRAETIYRSSQLSG
jgi:hypothetical protein